MTSRQAVTIMVSEIQPHDEFWFQGILHWTAMAPSIRTAIGWSVRVEYPDGSFDHRYWRDTHELIITISRIT